METRTDLRQLYLDLADGYERREQPQFRDRFLVLAADAALAAGATQEAERVRQRLLGVNPHHMLKPYPSFGKAMEIDDVQHYVRDLRKNYPPDIARGLLRSMHQIDEAHERHIPVTSPLLNLGGEPDVLMDEQDKPLDVLSFMSDLSPAVPPTLAPNSLPRPSVATPPRPVPQPRYGDEIPLTLPPAPRPAPHQVAPPAPKPRPVPTPQVAAPRIPPSPRPAPAPSTRPVVDSEGEQGGAWLAALLFGVVAATGLAFAGYALFHPFFPGQ